MDSIEADSILIKALNYNTYSLIQLLSEDDVLLHFGITRMDYLPKSFLQPQWEVRDFELLLDLTGNLDAHLY